MTGMQRLWSRCGPRHLPCRRPGGGTLLLAAVLSGCASGPPPPDWQRNSKSALEQAVAAELRGDSRVAAQEFERARADIASTGRPDLLARAELLRCAAQMASLQLGPCAGFEALRLDAAPAELAYADHLAGRLAPGQAALLPAAQQTLAAAVAAPMATGASDAGDAGAAALLQALPDPMSRLLGAALLLQAGRAGPAVLAEAVHTASAQGWRRPLLAWLGLQHQRAALAGDAEATARLQRRINLVGGLR